jgi:hypothetical protein
MTIALRKAQSNVFKDIQDNRFVMVFCGRRFGKTYLLIAIALYLVANGTNRIVYIAPTYDQAKRIFWKRLLNAIPHGWIFRKQETSPQTIEFKNGSILSVHGAQNYDTLRGEGYDAVLIDEAADCPSEMLHEVIDPAISDTEGKVIIAGTPKGQANWCYDEWVSGHWITHSYTTLDGGNVSADEIARASRTLDERTFNQEYLAKFETSNGLVYYAFSNDNITDTAYDPSANSFLTFDFNVGMNKPLACYLIQEQQGQYIVTNEFSYLNSNTVETSEAVSEWLANNRFGGTLQITGDYAGNRRETSATRSDYQIIEQYFKHHRGFKRVTRPTTTIKDRVASLNAMLCNANKERKLFIHRDCKRLINDFRRVQWKESGAGLDDSNDELTHASDAVTYFTYNYFPVHRGQIKFAQR